MSKRPATISARKNSDDIGGRRPPEDAPACLPISIEGYLPYLINSIAIKLTKAAGPRFAAFDLTIPKWRILLTVYEHGMLRFRDLALLTSIEPPTLSRLLNLMQGDGLCRRRRGRSDNRSVMISLTNAGRQLFERTIPWATTVEEGLLAGLDDADTAALRQLLARIYQNLDGGGDGNRTQE